MPPISSSRSAPRTTCNSLATSMWASHVRRSCFGALLSALTECSVGRFMAHFAFSKLRLLRIVERAARHGTHEIAAIIRRCIGVLKRVDSLGGGFGSGGKNVRRETPSHAL